MIAGLGQLILLGALAVIIGFVTIVLFTVMIPALRKEYGITKDKKHHEIMSRKNK